MILWVDEDRVVGASGHARLATDTDRFVEVDDAVRALKHCGSRTGSDARCVRALITTGHLMSAARLGKDPDVDMLDVGARYADGYDVFRFACRRARMTADATRVVDYLRPLHALVATWLLIDHVAEAKAWRTITCNLARPATSVWSEAEFQGAPHDVEIPRVRAAIVLTQVVDLKGEVFVYSLGNPEIRAITSPPVKMGIVKDLISQKSGYTMEFQRTVDLEAIPFVDKIGRWRAPVILESLAIAQEETTPRHLDCGFEGESFFFIRDWPPSLIFKVGVKWEKDNVFSNLGGDSYASGGVFGNGPFSAAPEMKIAQQN